MRKYDGTVSMARYWKIVPDGNGVMLVQTSTEGSLLIKRWFAAHSYTLGDI